MSSHRASKRKSRWILFAEVFCRAAVLSFLRYFVIVGFVLGILSKTIPVSGYLVWLVLPLGTLGIWKLFDYLEKLVEDRLERERSR